LLQNPAKQEEKIAVDIAPMPKPNAKRNFATQRYMGMQPSKEKMKMKTKRTIRTRHLSW
jgi:hypothetical protein